MDNKGKYYRTKFSKSSGKGGKRVLVWNENLVVMYFSAQQNSSLCHYIFFCLSVNFSYFSFYSANNIIYLKCLRS